MSKKQTEKSNSKGMQMPSEKMIAKNTAANERTSASRQKKETESVSHLKRVLADTFVLYMKTYVVHWNYTGANFFSVHKLTEGQYQELAEAIDSIAERIRAIGTEAPLSLSDVLLTADLKEMSDDSDPVKALRELAEGHKLLAERAKEAAEATEENSDYYSNDMMIGRIGSHDKASWMLESLVSR
jgi:starvation-inducible DNA-binding protein